MNEIASWDEYDDLVPETDIDPDDCDHRAQRSVAYRVRGGSIQHRKQCITCGGLTSSALPLSALPPDAPSISYKDIDAAHDIRAAEKEKRRIEQQERDRKEWFAAHDRYLSTATWANKRDSVMRRCNHACEGCGNKRAVHVHHLTYKHWREEFLFELVGLCKECHERIHAVSLEG